MTQPKHRREFGSVRRLPSKRFQARYVAPDGQAIARTFPTRTDAEGFLVNARRQIDTGRWRRETSHKVTFAAYSEQWLEHREVGGRSLKQRTIDHYRDILDRHLLPTFGPRPIASITPKDVRDWHSTTLTHRATYRAHAYGLLRAICNSAVADELLDANPCRLRGASRTTRAHRIRTATPAELAALYEAMPPKLALMVPLAGWLGLRFGEAVALTRADVDLSAGLVRVRKGAVRTRDGYQVDTTKSVAGHRDIAIPPHILPLIEAHLAEYVAAGEDSRLFATEGGGFLQPATFNRHWYKARGAVGRSDLRYHDLRHTAATLAASTGASLRELMTRMGHSSVGASIRYQHASQARDAEIAEKLSKLASL